MKHLKRYGEYGNTERERCHFVVRQYSGGEWIVALEPDGDELDALKGGILALEVPSGTRREKAEELAEYLNHHVEGVSFTRLPYNP